MARKISRINRTSIRSNQARDGMMFRKESRPEHSFFGRSDSSSFFTPARGYGEGQLVQPKCKECEEEDKVQKKQENPEENQEEMTFTPTYSEQSVVEQNTRHFANCEGVTVQGHTDANYGNSFTAPGSSTRGRGCTDCSGEDCITNSGTVVSVFTTNPQVTLPSVPSGLNECEQNAVQNFINTTLMAHEQQHVAAFNTYRGTVRTPYTYRGCASGLDAHTQQVHTNIETARKSRSDAASAALDANGANIFNITCECPDP